MSSPTVSTQLQRLAEQAREHPTWQFTTLAHHMDENWLRAAYAQVRKQGAAGVDRVTAQVYAQHLEANLHDLHARLKNGQYVAPPVRRVWLEKADGRQRPIGIPTFEDKIVQRAVEMLLSAIYEQDFYAFSYGFRRGYSAHQALQALRARCMQGDIHWVLDADISGCFEHLQHGKLQAIMQERVNDGRILQLVGKWLHAGVMEGGHISYPEAGAPQGGVISPLLMNIYLHTVLDSWFEQEVRPRLRGRCFIIRYADDFVIGCQYEDDARRIKAVLPKRFARYGLTIHPEKSRLVRFQPPWEGRKHQQRSFDFLGFMHYWARSRRGRWVVLRRTARERQRRAIQRFRSWCREHQHLPLPEQARQLEHKLRGYYQYYAIRGNSRALQHVYYQVRKAWLYWLRRRGGKRQMTWVQFNELLRQLPIPPPRILHDI